MQINQFLPNLDYGDAIGNHAIEIKKTLINAGYDSEIYVNSSSDKVKKHCKHYSDYRPDKKNIIIFHFSIGSILDDFILNLKEKLIIIYHNTTPPRYFYGINDRIARLLENTDETLSKLKERASLSIGVSEFNSNQLKKIGFKNVITIPLMVDLKSYENIINKELYNRYNDNYINIIFVGRLIPNKKQEDLLKTFYIYNRYINPKSRLFIIGGYNGMEIYYNELIRIKKELDLDNAIITGFVSFEDMVTYYKLADIFLCMSEHEGFLVPAIESMKLKVPILAFRSSALPYTLKDAGIIFNKKDYGAIAELIDYAVKNREQIIKIQNKRLEFFNPDKIKKELIEAIKKVSDE